MSKKTDAKADLPIVQQTYDLILWYVPLLNRLPRDHKFLLGDRMATGMYDVLSELILSRYTTNKLPRLEAINGRLDVLRYQTRLLKDFALFDLRRYEHACRLIDAIGRSLGGWVKQQRSLAK